MFSNGGESFHNEIQEVNKLEAEAKEADSNGGGNTVSGGTKLVDFIPIYIPAVPRGSLDHSRHERRFFDFLKARPSRDWFLSSGFVGRLSAFSFIGRRNSSASPSPVDGGAATAGRRRFRVPFVRKVNWGALWISFKRWIKNPANMALFIWLVVVTAGLILLALVMLGVLNGAIPSSSRRKKWMEVINQILNALFMIMCLYQHPRLFHHLWLLIKWTSNDRKEVRAIYCKGGGERPHDRSHILFVVLLLHITCLSQYALCGLFWGYSRSNRPDWAVNVCLGVGVAAPIIAGVYTVKSPLGRRIESDEEQSFPVSPVSAVTITEEGELRQYNRRVVVTEPEWIGGLLDCLDDPTVFFLSFSCVFCVFGWNVERLGFGNMYVHIFTFILLCVGPILVFSAAALSIDDYGVRYSVGGIGVLLCPLGLFYGGYWRTQMRKRFHLPADGKCCRTPAVADFFRWFFCWSCSLAQEVRTGNFYDIGDDSFYQIAAKEEDGRPVMSPTNREWPPETSEILAADSDALRSLSWSPKTPASGGGEGRYAEYIAGYLSPTAQVGFQRASTYSSEQALRPPVPLILLDQRHS